MYLNEVFSHRPLTETLKSPILRTLSNCNTNIYDTTPSQHVLISITLGKNNTLCEIFYRLCDNLYWVGIHADILEAGGKSILKVDAFSQY